MPLVEDVTPLLTNTRRFIGLIHRKTVLNSTLCRPVGTLVSVEPLVRQVLVPTRRHLAPALRAPCGSIVTLSEPLVVGTTYVYVPLVVAVSPLKTITVRFAGLVHRKTVLNSTV